MGESDEGKLFVGGISWDTNQETLKNHFNKYGSVLGSLIARDRFNGNPRGFGFVWFSHPSAAHNALQHKHVIAGREVEVKKAIPRGEGANQQRPQNNKASGSSVGGVSTRKIFVGGLSDTLTQQDFKNYFEKFGAITDVVVMHDSATHRPRGFGFVTFDLEDSVKNVMQKSFHELNGKLVEVKRAVPKDCTKTKTIISSGHSSSRQFSFRYCQQPAYSPSSFYPIRRTFPSYPNFNGYSGIGPGYFHGMDGYGGAICYGMSSFPIPGAYSVPCSPVFPPQAFTGNGGGTTGVIVYGGGSDQRVAVKSDWWFKPGSGLC